MESVKECRKRLGFTQKELAASCQVHHTHISHIECGRTNPSLEVFVKMTEELEVSAKRLLEMLSMRATRQASVTDVRKERRTRR